MDIMNKILTKKNQIFNNYVMDAGSLNRRCVAGRSELGINFEGKVSRCPQSGDYIGDLMVENLRRYGKKQIALQVIYFQMFVLIVLFLKCVLVDVGYLLSLHLERGMQLIPKQILITLIQLLRILKGILKAC